MCLKTSDDNKSLFYWTMMIVNDWNRRTEERSNRPARAANLREICWWAAFERKESSCKWVTAYSLRTRSRLKTSPKHDNPISHSAKIDTTSSEIRASANSKEIINMEYKWRGFVLGRFGLFQQETLLWKVFRWNEGILIKIN